MDERRIFCCPCTGTFQPAAPETAPNLNNSRPLLQLPLQSPLTRFHLACCCARHSLGQCALDHGALAHPELELVEHFVCSLPEEIPGSECNVGIVLPPGLHAGEIPNE